MRISVLFMAAITMGIGVGGCAAKTVPAARSSFPGIHWEKYSDQVFAEAKQENKFVLMDLEAVWCHWCHVQDDITYRDPKVIDLINARYIAVKVDQDSRPDLSSRYEDYGWPATIILNKSGGEIAKRQGYIPPRPMASLLQAVIDDPTPGPSVTPEHKIDYGQTSALSPNLRKELEAKLDNGYDAKEGGWGTVHKFIDWDALEYSMALVRHGDTNAVQRVRQTLDAGTHLIDPAWGGVYQYSTDGDWLHPHFEKLMEFQSQVLRIYSLAYAQFHDNRYLDAAGAIRHYIASFLTSPDGVFYVSQNADLVDGEHSAAYFALDDAARRKLGMPRVDQHEYARENGWAIRGILAFYDVTQNPADLNAAIKAAEWVIKNRSVPGGGFSHDQHDPAGPYLDDSLSMGRAFLCLYEATSRREWLSRAQAAATFIFQHFEAGAPGASDAPGFVIARPSKADVLKPTPEIDLNVACARFFNLLANYTGDTHDKKAAAESMRFLATPQVANSRGLFVSGILLANLELSTLPMHVTIVGRKTDPQASQLFMQALKMPTGYRRLEWWDKSDGPLPYSDVEYPDMKEAAAFVCTGNACSSPIARPEKLGEKLGL